MTMTLCTSSVPEPVMSLATTGPGDLITLPTRTLADALGPAVELIEWARERRAS